MWLRKLITIQKSNSYKDDKKNRIYTNTISSNECL